MTVVTASARSKHCREDKHSTLQPLRGLRPELFADSNLGQCKIRQSTTHRQATVRHVLATVKPRGAPF
eukprot:scaffold65137_cov94-Phaeocystis_antarctica.AAC.2